MQVTSIPHRLLWILAACLVVCTCFVETATSSPVCEVPDYGSRMGLGSAATAGLGIPAYLARNARANLRGEVTTLGPTDSPPRPGVGLGGSVRGVWGRHGYRVDWFDIVPGGTVCDNYPGYWNLSLSYVFVLLRDARREVAFSAGGGVGGLPHDAISLSLAMNVEHRLGEHFLLSGRIRYLPNFPTSRRVSNGTPEQRLRFEHGVRARARFQWRLTPGFQPHLSVLTGLHDSRDANTRSDRSADAPEFGLHVSGLLGFESRWGPDN